MSRPTAVTLTIDTTGAAFDDPDIPDAALTSEVARILRSAATALQRTNGIDRLALVDANGNVVGRLDAHLSEPEDHPTATPADLAAGRQEAVQRTEDVPIDALVSFIVLMQGNGGIRTKSPSYIAEKFRRLASGEVQSLDALNMCIFDDWRSIWSA